MTDDRIKWTKKEDDYLRRYYRVSTNVQILTGLTFISKTQKTVRAIQNRIAILGLKGRKLGGKRYNSIKNQPVQRPPSIYIPKIRPYIKSRPLMHAMESAGISLFDIARVTGEHIDVLRGWVRQGGLPKEFIEPVKELVGDYV